MQFYTDPEREKDPNALPDAEAFHVPNDYNPQVFDEDSLGECEVSNTFPPGFYWWSCLPGCLPDSDPFGPFETEQEAVADARERAEY